MSQRFASTLSDQVAYAQNAFAEAGRALLPATLSLFFVGLLAFGTLGLVAFEMTVSYTVMHEVFGPELPDQPTPLSVLILSAATLVGVAGFHVMKAKNPDNRAFKLLERLAPVLLVFFFVSLVAVYGLHEAVNSASQDSVVLTDGTIAPASDSGFLSGLFKMLTGFSLGGLVVVNLVVIHSLIEKIQQVFPGALAKFQNARLTRKVAKAFLTNISLRSAAQRERNTQVSVAPEAQAETAAGEIEAALAPTLRELSKITARDANQPIDPSDPMAVRDPNLPHPAPDAEAIERYLAAMEDDLAALPSKLTPLFQ